MTNPNNELKGPSPAGLTRTHSEVTVFKAEYENWADDESYGYPSLSTADAEWMLEACFNFEHRFYDEGDEQAAVISYEESDDYPLELTGSTISPEDLFQAYDHLMTIANGFDDLAPMTDLEIAEDGEDLVLLVLLARTDRFRDLTPQRRPYSEPHFAVAPVTYGPQGPRKLCASTLDPDYYAPALLTYNLGLTYDPWISNGYHTDVYTNTYGSNAFQDFIYEGFYDSSKNYELSIWGIHPSVNPASTATGEADECLSPTQLSYYENAIEDLMNEQTPTLLRVHNVKVDPELTFHASEPSGWWHHTLTFTWSKFTEL